MAFHFPAWLILNRNRTGQDEMKVPDATGIQWRHELKYELSVSEAAAIRSRLQAIAEPDPHSGKDGRYWIRSLYFDSYRDVALQEKLNGVNLREKFRIRYYNRDPSWLKLEKKYKRNGLGTKFSEKIHPETVQDILNGSNDWFPETIGRNNSEYERPLLMELYSKMRFACLRPKIIIDYVREPYQFEAGNVRVTFDYNLRVSWNLADFLNPECDTVPADYPLRAMDDSFRIPKIELAWPKPKNVGERLRTENIGERLQPENGELPIARPPLLMEVKWDNFLPGIIQEVIQTPCLPAGAFSKYAYSRVFFDF